MKKLLTPFIIVVTIVVSLLTVNVANPRLIDPENIRPEMLAKPKTMCEPAVLTQEHRDACVICIVELTRLKALRIERFDTHTVGARIQSTSYWDAWDVTADQILGVISAIFIINPEIKRIIMGIETIPMFEFTYDGTQLCATCLNTG